MSLREAVETLPLVAFLIFIQYRAVIMKGSWTTLTTEQLPSLQAFKATILVIILRLFCPKPSSHFAISPIFT